MRKGKKVSFASIEWRGNKSEQYDGKHHLVPKTLILQMDPKVGDEVNVRWYGRIWKGLFKGMATPEKKTRHKVERKRNNGCAPGPSSVKSTLHTSKKTPKQRKGMILKTVSPAKSVGSPERSTVWRPFTPEQDAGGEQDSQDGGFHQAEDSLSVTTERFSTLGVPDSTGASPKAFKALLKTASVRTRYSPRAASPPTRSPSPTRSSSRSSPRMSTPRRIRSPTLSPMSSPSMYTPRPTRSPSSSTPSPWSSPRAFTPTPISPLSARSSPRSSPRVFTPIIAKSSASTVTRSSPRAIRAVHVPNSTAKKVSPRASTPISKRASCTQTKSSPKAFMQVHRSSRMSAASTSSAFTPIPTRASSSAYTGSTPRASTSTLPLSLTGASTSTTWSVGASRKVELFPKETEEKNEPHSLPFAKRDEHSGTSGINTNTHQMIDDFLEQMDESHFKNLVSSACLYSNSGIPGPRAPINAHHHHTLALMEKWDDDCHLSNLLLHHLQDLNIKLQGPAFLKLMEIVLLEMHVKLTNVPRNLACKK